jgi:hypothetical protein
MAEGKEPLELLERWFSNKKIKRNLPGMSIQELFDINSS